MPANFFEFQQSLRKTRSAPPLAPGAEATALTVSEVTAKITKAIASGVPPSVLVRGEVSNFKINRASGHYYFTLKDSGACLDCVMFRGDAERLKFNPEAGLELLAGGRISVYAPHGKYQLLVNSLRPLGKGALELAFSQMRSKLEREGLFAAERKKLLPAYPLRIVLITSREAAALHDMLKVLGRFRWLQLFVYSVPVQGDGAAQKVAAAITHLNRSIDLLGGADVILLARGGGSLEDLWCFNEECVARAMAASRIPIVTGIGHEVDVSIADLVADHHAHTPTEAAQVITAQWRTIRDRLDDSMLRVRRGSKAILSDAGQRLRAIERHEAFRRPMDRVNHLRQYLDDRQRSMILAQERCLRSLRDRIQHAVPRIERFLPALLSRYREMLSTRSQRIDQYFALLLRRLRDRLAQSVMLFQEHHPRLRIGLAAQRLDTARDGLARAIAHHSDASKFRLEALARELEAISPQSVLRRGYTITTAKKGGLPLRSAGQVKPGDMLITRFADGQVESRAHDSRQLSLFE